MRQQASYTWAQVGSAAIDHLIWKTLKTGVGMAQEGREEDKTGWIQVIRLDLGGGGGSCLWKTVIVKEIKAGST